MSAAPAAHSARTAATREKLYVAAISLFGKHGIDQVTVDEIASVAGVAKGTVYYNFRGKDALVGALIEDRIARLVTQVNEAPGNDDPIVELVDVLLEFVQNETEFVQLIVGELWRPSSRWREQLFAIREQVITAIERLLAKGGWQPRTPYRATAGGVLVTSLGIGLDWRVYSPERPRAAVAEQLRLLFDH